MKCVKCDNEINSGSPFCGSCGTPAPTPTKFCGGCGAQVDLSSKFCGTCGFVFDDVGQMQMPIQQKDTANISTALSSLKVKLNNLKPHIIKYKVPIIIALSVIIIAIIGWNCFQKFYDHTKLSWEETYGDYKVTHISGGNLELKVEAHDKENRIITDIEYTVDGGTVESNGQKVVWNLPDKDGTYTITAKAPSGKKVIKEVKVVTLSNDVDNTVPVGFDTTEEDENTDSDADGILNDKEKELGTNPYSADSDNDGLSDKYEIEESKTEPIKADTDGDGIDDGDELDLGLDPLKNDSKGDGIKDGDRELTYTVANGDNEISIELTGKGNISSTTIDVINNSTFDDMDGLLDEIYNFYSEGKISNAIVTIKYDEEEIKEQNLVERNLTLYYFNEETKELEAMPTEVDEKNNTITVTLKHFSKYVVGDKNLVLTNTKAQIMFVIDNSVSMYSQEQMTEAGYSASTGADGNDIEFKRLSLTNKLVGMFTGNYEFGVAEFSGNYVNLQKFSSDSKTIETAVNKMKSKWNSDAEGTDIIEALESGLDEFAEDDNSHYLVLMTDGKNTEGYLSQSRNSIIQEAKEKNVKICVIGLGDDIDTDDLNEIAESTGCDYYHASNSSALDEIYALVGADINYNLVDTDNDGKADGMIVADSGFITTRDGFSFPNFASIQSEGGNCFGMAMFAMLYYKDELPLKLDAKTDSKFYLRYMKTFEWVSSGYNLDNTYFERNNPLYEYTLEDEAVRLRLKDFPSDIRDRIEDGVYYVNDKYYNLFSNIGIGFDIKDYDGDDKEFNKYQAVGYIDVENDKFIKNADNDDVQLLKAIWRLFMLQMHGEEMAFSSEPDKSYDKLFSELENGTPMVIGVGGNHAVNAVRLIQDLEDANKFKLEVYDNNYPGETRYIEITRNKYNKIQLNYTAWVNEYNYTFKYDDKDTTVELSLAEAK